MKKQILVFILTIGVSIFLPKPLAAVDSAVLNCTCYKSFEKQSGQTQPFNRDIALSMYRSRKYEKILEFCQQSIKRPNDGQQSIAWISEAGFALSEIDSNNGDPQMAPQIILDSASDPVEHTYRHTFENGPNFWSAATMKKYGGLTVCTSQCFTQNANPNDENFTNYHLRLMSVYLRAQRFEAILQFIERLPKKNAMVKINTGQYLDFAGQYIGFNTIPEGIKFLQAIKKNLNPNPAALRHWRQVYLYAIDHNNQMSSQSKRQMTAKIEKEL